MALSRRVKSPQKNEDTEVPVAPHKSDSRDKLREEVDSLKKQTNRVRFLSEILGIILVNICL